MHDYRKDDPLAHEPFSYEQTKDDKIQIFFSSRLVKTIKGKDAELFLFKITGAGERDSQLIMAKVTGKFKFGHEKDRRQKKKEE
ncbi:MAG: hypothetical protein HQ506_04740 [Candidatus Marinimicrobia bacterium]|nr:hypothetical protein [Candidatus Neomarinimicrobiota bacterium]